ncbi:Alpha-aminoadipate--LysW ligase LysX [compost metagenome]
MTKQITVLIGDKGTSGERFVEQMTQHSNDTYVLRRYADIAVIIKDGNVRCVYMDDQTDVASADLVYLRGITYEPLRHALAAYLDAKGVKLVNSESLRYQTMSKLEQYVTLALAGVPVPDSVFVSRPDYYSKVSDLLGNEFPIVAKSITGSNGRDNELLTSQSELDQLDMEQPIFQAFIPNQFDYRVIVADDHVSLAYKRIRNASGENYKNNIAQGGRREMVELPAELQDIAIRAAHAVGREFCGLDILTSSETGCSIVLEVNFNFGTPVFDSEDAEASYYGDLSAYFARLMQ